MTGWVTQSVKKERERLIASTQAIIDQGMSLEVQGDVKQEFIFNLTDRLGVPLMPEVILSAILCLNMRFYQLREIASELSDDEGVVDEPMMGAYLAGLRADMKTLLEILEET